MILVWTQSIEDWHRTAIFITSCKTLIENVVMKTLIQEFVLF